jgi:hypothetical protein
MLSSKVRLARASCRSKHFAVECHKKLAVGNGENMRTVLRISIVVVLTLCLLIPTISCTKRIYVLGPSIPPQSPKGLILTHMSGLWGSPVSCYEGRSEQCWWVPIHATVTNIGGDGVVKVRVDVNYDTPLKDSTYLQPSGYEFQETQVYLKYAEKKELEFDFWLPARWTYRVWCP